MSKREMILIVSRALAVYLFCWGFSVLTYIPVEVAQLTRNRGQMSDLWRTSDRWYTYDMLSLEAAVFRVVALLAASFLFYECGPRVQKFLLPEEKSMKRE